MDALVDRRLPAVGSAIVLGANGRLGLAAVAAFQANGWHVRAFMRGKFVGPAFPHLECVHGDALDEKGLLAAAQGFDVIINALNVPYRSWETLTPKLTDVIISVARKTGATVLLPGNVYHYGQNMPQMLSERTLCRPSTTLGRVRETMEQTYAGRSAIDGFQTVILRAGDFFGPTESTQARDWFISQIIAKLDQNKLVYPGPLNRLHAWAYLPDLARAMVELAQCRERLAPFSSLGFPGFSLTGEQLVTALEEVTGRKYSVRALPWWLVRVGSLVSGDLRGVLQMRYLWQRAHQIDGTVFQSMFPDFVHTPLTSALALSIARKDVSPITN